MIAHLRKFRMSPKKASIIAGIIRGRSVTEALAMLEFVPNKGALPLRKCLASAVANAEHNESKNREDLVVETVIVNKGLGMRRFKPGPRGRAMRLRKPVTHFTIHLAEMPKSTPEKPAKASKKTEKAAKKEKVAAKSTPKETKTETKTKKD